MTRRIKLINASAGSGKTYRLKEELATLLSDKTSGIRPMGVIATTFTRGAAQELKERARLGVLEKGLREEANLLEGALVGTVHSVCQNLIQIFSYETGLSPQLRPVSEDDLTTFFNWSLGEVTSPEINSTMFELGQAVGNGINDVDWRDQVRSICDYARANGLKAEGLGDSAVKSLESFFSFFPKPKPKGKAQTINEKVAQALESGINTVEAEIKVDKKTTEIIPKFRQMASKLKNGKRVPWDDWAKLSRPGIGKKGMEAFDEATILAQDWESHPDLHDDVTAYTTKLFDIAKNALNAYEKFKEERGLIDFTDMETRCLALLDLAPVRERIQNEYDLLLVDEFQDTNPIQLAIFLKLSEIVGKSIWVGDPKQSIYAFRGADPELMLTLLKHLEKHGEIDTLNKSWRSRPHLVHFSNGFFSKAFKDIFEEDKISLLPDRKEDEILGDGIEHWHLKPNGKKNNKDMFYRSLGHHIASYIESGRKVFDKDTKKYRDLVAGDIAVLCRSNDECGFVGEALSQEGHEVGMEGGKLLNTPEGMLTMAALRLIYSKEDTLAEFELRLLLSDEPNVAKLLDERLLALENKETEWGKRPDCLALLDRLREETPEISPSEAIDEIIICLDLERQVARWGRSKMRLASLNRFRELSTNYEESCQGLSVPATLAGFLMWLDEKEPAKGKGTGRNAVNVLTYHKSKGLEWPVVILTGLEKEAWPRLYGIQVVDERDKIDLSDPLGGRWIRLWPTLYHGNRSQIPSKDAISESVQAQKAQEDAERENARLLYVGVTRARDSLIFVTRPRAEELWMRQTHGDGFSLPTEGGIHENFGEWNGHKFPLHTKCLEMLEEFESKSSQPGNVFVMPSNLGEAEFASYRISPSNANDIPSSLKVGELSIYGDRMNINGKVDEQLLGDAVHAIYCLPDTYPAEHIDGVLGRYGITPNVEAAEVLKNKMAFFDYIDKSFAVLRCHKELPLLSKIDGRLISGIADLLIETEDEVILVDHKTFQGGKDKLKQKAEEYAGQLELYRRILCLSFKGKEIRSFLNFTTSSALIELILEK